MLRVIRDISAIFWSRRAPKTTVVSTKNVSSAESLAMDDSTPSQVGCPIAPIGAPPLECIMDGSIRAMPV